MTKPDYQDIPLSKLEVDPQNVRAGVDYDKQALAQLATTIVEQGLKQSLLVRPGKGDKFLVTAGGRRLAAMKLAVEAGKLATDFAPPCMVREMTDAEAHEASLLENVEREQMTPVQQFKAWHDLRENGASTADIAARFGVTEKLVAQRLALADLHPNVLKLLEAGKITLGAAQAFTLGSKQQQAAYVKTAQHEWQLREGDVRRAMTNSKVSASTWLATEFIGAEAYEKAGGKVESDLFGDEAYWISEQIVNRLTEERFAKVEEEAKAEGWGFVKRRSDYDHRFYSLRRFYKSGGKFKPEEKATSGVVIDIDNGEIIEGVQDPSIVKPWSADKKKTDDAPAKDPLAISAALSQRLSEARNAAVAEVLANDPAKALRVMIAMLDAATASSRHPSHFSAKTEWDSGRGTMPSRRPFRELLGEALALSDEEAMKRVCELAARNVDVTDKHCMTYSVTAYPDDCADALVSALDPDPLPHFDPEDYSKSVGKPVLIAAITDIRNGKDCGDLEKAKKVHLAEQLRIEVSGKYRPEGKNWLPPQLRTASYSGPAYEPKKPRKTTKKKAA
jgi:ParB/RepB/Spo0J family partition protein